jgi:hypothetical protein
MNNNNYELHRALDLITEQTKLMTLKGLKLLRFYNLDKEGDFVNFIIYPQASMVKIKRDVFSIQMIAKLNEYPLALLSRNMFFHLDNRAFSSLANALSVKNSSYKDLVSMAEEQNDRGVIDRYYASFADFIAQANTLNVVARIDDTGREVILVNQGSRMNLIPQNWIVLLADEIGGLTLMDYHITKSITSVFYKKRVKKGISKLYEFVTSDNGSSAFTINSYLQFGRRSIVLCDKFPMKHSAKITKEKLAKDICEWNKKTEKEMDKFIQSYESLSTKPFVPNPLTDEECENNYKIVTTMVKELLPGLMVKIALRTKKKIIDMTLESIDSSEEYSEQDIALILMAYPFYIKDFNFYLVEQARKSVAPAISLVKEYNRG